MYTRGNSIRSWISRRCSAVIGGVWTVTAGGSGLRLNEPKYFSTQAFACALSKSPASTSVALLGA